jgi:alkylhydroperoxidase/carboxymuconolactone decarboxylase family protein YurZ
MFNFVETPARNADHLQIKNLKYMTNGGSSDFAEKVNAITAAAAADQKPRRSEDVWLDKAMADHNQKVNAIAAAAATEQKLNKMRSIEESYNKSYPVLNPLIRYPVNDVKRSINDADRSEDVWLDKVMDDHNQKELNAIAAAAAIEQKLNKMRSIEESYNKSHPVLNPLIRYPVNDVKRSINDADRLRIDQKSPQVVQTQTNSIMVGFQVKPDNKYLDHHRVNRINNLLTTSQIASCSFLIQNADHVLDRMFDKQATVNELDCDEALRRADLIYNKGMINLHSRGDRQLITPMLTLGYGLFTDMIRDTCDTNNKITRESVSEAAKALLKVACNVPQF